MTIKSNKWVLSVLLLCFLLSGCIKVNINVEVNANDSGTLSMLIGMSKELLAMMSTEGSDPMEELKNEIPSDLSDEEAEISSWSDDEYEWIEVTKKFNNLTELNILMSEVEFFETFSLTKEDTLLKNNYVLNAKFLPYDSLFPEGELPPEFSNPPSDTDELPPDLDEPPAEFDDLFSGIDLDPSNFIDIKFSIKLPGELTENTGNYLEDEKLIEWYIEDTQQSDIHAVSENWNTRNITIIGVSVFLIGFIFVLFIIFLVYMTRKR